MDGIEFVVFDIGETIVCEDRVWTEWAEWLNVTPSVLFAVLGALIAERKDHRLAFELIRPGFDFESERATKEAEGVSCRLGADDLYPDVRACFEQLAASGFRIGLAGNQPIAIEPMLEELSLPVQFVASSARWGVAKPSEEFFQRVISTADVPARRIAYVGDRLDNDVLPAKRAGMFSIFIRRGPWGHIQDTWPEVDLADARIESLSEVPAVLAALQ